MKRIAGIFVVCCILVLPGPGASQSSSGAKLLKPPFVPTPMEDVRQMLRMASAGPGDILYDLGSGDGRIPITAVAAFGVTKGVGFDIDDSLVRLSNKNAREAGADDRARFHHGDVFKVDFSEATVVTMYLLQDVNLALRSRLLAELQPGTRIVSYEFDLGDWKPDAVHPEETDTWEKEFIDIDEAPPRIFFWVVPARVAGRWDVTFGDVRGRLSLTQRHQELTGEILIDGNAVPIQAGRLNGMRIRFDVPQERGGAGGTFSFDGRVTGPTMRGAVKTPDEEWHGFRATKED